MKGFWCLIVLAVADAVALGASIARRDTSDIVLFVVFIVLLLGLAFRALRLWQTIQRWEAWRTAEANLAASGSANWRGGTR